MADNTQLPVPSTSGDVIATDDISGVKYQRVKMTLGADGVNDGDVSSANPLPVEIQGALGTADTKALGTNLVDGDVGIVSNTVIHGKTTAGGGSFVDVKVNPSGALSVAVGESALPTGAATEATLSAIQTLETTMQGVQNEIKVLNDTMLVLLSAILEKMPRVTGADQAVVSIESIASNLTLGTVSTLGTQNQMGSKFISGDNQMLSGINHIYSNITVA